MRPHRRAGLARKRQRPSRGAQVVVQDEILTPLENILDFDRYGIRLPRARLPDLPAILRSVPPERVRQLQRGIGEVWERFTYSSLARMARGRRCGVNGWGSADSGCAPPTGSSQASVPTRLSDDALVSNPNLRGNDALDAMLHVLKARLLDGGVRTPRTPD